jgi:acyl transferase domain-containing protein
MENYNGTEIAVIGMSGRFPGAENINDFWANLRNGKEGISFFSNQELIDIGLPEDALNSPSFVRASAYIDNKEFFDSELFGYIPSEAALMDPQMRLFHECCWGALEDAGYNSRKYEEKIGLFAGGSISSN